VPDGVTGALSAVSREQMAGATALFADRTRRCSSPGRAGMRLMHVGEATAPSIAHGAGLVMISGSVETPVTLPVVRPARRWALENCRHLSRVLERDLVSAGESVVQVSPKLMGSARRSGRELGKSDPIDALAVARAALREPHLPVAQLDGRSREVKLLVDHREDLVGERTRIQNRLLWHLHELDPSWAPSSGDLWRPKHLRAIEQRIADTAGNSSARPGAVDQSAEVRGTRKCSRKRAE